MHAWIDASAGIAGDMLLGALLDAGADLEVVRAAVSSLVGESVRITVAEVTRAGLRAAKAEVEVTGGRPTPPDVDRHSHHDRECRAGRAGPALSAGGLRSAGDGRGPRSRHPGGGGVLP